MGAWIGAADLPGEGGSRSLQRGPFVRLEVEADQVVVIGVGPLSRVFTEQHREPSGVRSVQLARGFLAPKGLRLDLSDGEVIYFGPGTPPRSSRRSGRWEPRCSTACTDDAGWLPVRTTTEAVIERASRNV